jgi:cytochrome c peroxidase
VNRLYLGLTLLFSACAEDGVIDAKAAAAARAELSPLVLAGVLRASPLPSPPVDPSNRVVDNPNAIELGRILFYDQRFSANGSISCATCHDPALDWSDGKVTAEGLSSFNIHSPSLWNVAYNRWYFWDGRADSLWAQAIQPWEHPDEMGGNRVAFTHTIIEDSALRAKYEALFGQMPDVSAWPREARPTLGDLSDPAQPAWHSMPADAREASTQVLVNMAKAVAAFERELVSGESRFDRYVSGLQSGAPQELASLSSEEIKGMKLFFDEARCHLCHHGPLFSDLEFHDVRLPYERNERGEELREFGRWDGIKTVLNDPYNGKGEFSDVGALQPGETLGDLGSARGHLEFLLRTPHTKGEFKTPGLRNVARTAPYTHRGVYESLEEVIEHYSSLHDAPTKRHADSEEILIPIHLNREQKAAIIAFLGALSGPKPSPSMLAPRPSAVSPESSE